MRLNALFTSENRKKILRSGTAQKVKVLLISIFIFLMYRSYITEFFAQAFAMEEFSFVNVIKILIPYSLIDSLAFALVIMYVNRFADKLSKNLWEKIASILFALCFMSGDSMATVGAFAEKFYSKRMLVFYLIYFIGCYLTFRFVLYHLRNVYKWIRSSNLQYRFSDKCQFLISFAIIAVCWSPYIILRYPAGFEMDAYFQIADFLDGTMTAHWPPASSAWMGIFVLAGDRLMGSTSIGIFCYCLVQLLIGSGVFSYIALVMRRFNVPAIWTYISIIVFALVPVYPGYITSVVKDSPFSIMVVLFVVLMTQILYMGPKSSLYIGLSISGMLMCILRNNGIFILIGIILALLIATIVLRKKVQPVVFGICLIQIVLTILYSSFLLPALGIAPTSEAEALSVPFQQTARLASFYPEEITDDEAVIISKVLNLDTISTDYDPVLSDPVKATYRSDDKAELMAYFLIWAKEGLRRPDVYIDAFLANARGFVYPDVRLGNSIVVSGVYTQVYELRDLKFGVPYSQILKNESFQEKISVIENLPVVFPFVNTALQLWIPILIMIYAIHKKDRKMLYILVPSIIGVLVCLASPTYSNNGARYALPVVYSNLFLLGLLLRKNNR